MPGWGAVFGLAAPLLKQVVTLLRGGKKEIAGGLALQLARKIRRRVEGARADLAGRESIPVAEARAWLVGLDDFGDDAASIGGVLGAVDPDRVEDPE